MLNIGITTRAFKDLSVSDAARRISAGGFRCTELCFWHSDLGGWAYNGIGSLDGITPAVVRKAAEEFTSRGVDVTALGLFTDMRNRDPAVRQSVLDYTRRYIEFAAEAGIPTISTECGFTPGARGLDAEAFESDYEILKEMLRSVCLEAEAAGVHLALEACVLDLIPSPRRLKTLIEELEAESHVRLGALLDPANFIANSDEEGMFCYLKHDVAYFHGKDRKINAKTGVNIGDGDIDWVKFMDCYIRYTDKAPFILEYCSKDNCLTYKKRAEDAYNEAFQTMLGRIN